MEPTRRKTAVKIEIDKENNSFRIVDEPFSKKTAVKIEIDKDIYSISTINKRVDFELTLGHTSLKITEIKNQVFISYSAHNKTFADEVYEKLKSAGIKVWMDTEKIRGGDNWRKEIEDALVESDIILVLLDKKSVKSHYVTYEWAFALGNKREEMVIPLIIENCKMHKRIDDIRKHHIDFSKGKNWIKLIDDIKSKLGRH